MQLPQLVRPTITQGSQSASFHSQQIHQQQQDRPERLPRCSTVSLQTELATPALVVFSGGTAFNSVAGKGPWAPAVCTHTAPLWEEFRSVAWMQRYTQMVAMANPSGCAGSA
jgi:hypothetical protein